MLNGAIDYWCNAFFPDREAAWRQAIDNQGLSLKVYRDGDEFCTPAEMVARMDEAGFATIVVVASARFADPTIDSFEHVAARAHEIASVTAAYPGRFAGLWSVDPTTGADGVAQAAEMVEQPWCVGLHNHTHSWDRPFDHPDFVPFYDLCARHDVPFVMQAGKSGGDFPHECGRPEGIDAPATDFPAVRFVLSHTGWPWTEETIERATRFDNVYLGTATWPLRRWSPELRAFATGAGRHKLMYGSGFPTTGHRQAARQFADPELIEGFTAADIERITMTNARAVFTRLP
ncbi:MAG: amidohydrolase family protein [Acidimicrobiales bacterium]|nr:amidohydrolase family protein [Acidimicrobiales bacterium]